MNVRRIAPTTCLLCVLAAAARGQEPTQPDSLARELQTLRARVDSLQQLLRQLTEGRRDTTPVVDELAALRAAAQAAAAEMEAGADTTVQQQSRTRDLSLLNPEISVTGDVVGSYTRPVGERDRVGLVPREFEFSFQAPLDPYTRTKIFAAYHEDVPVAGVPEVHGEEEATGAHGGQFEVEEAYVYWVGLPGAFGLKVGKFRQEIGLYNRWHTHALWEVDRPLPYLMFMGEDGLIQTGAGLTFPSLTVGPSTQTLVVQAATANNEVLFGEGGDMSILGRLQSFWDLSPATYVQLGATGVYGENVDEGLESRLFEIDFAFRWAPPNRALYQSLQLKGEWYYGRKEIAGLPESGKGAYAQLNYRVNRRLILGARGDYLYGFEDLNDTYQIVPSITWWQSEWLFARLQYNYVKAQLESANHTVLLQLVWAIGPHKHENY